jgi:hypothetical protein
MRLHDVLLIALAVLLPIPTIARAGEASENEMWECPAPDGTSLFTNKERPGCQPKELKPLSTVPSLPDTGILSSGAPIHHYDDPYRPEALSYDTPAGAMRNMKSVPDWAKDWHGSTTLAGSVQAEVCTMYGEWIRLNEKSRGGFFFGTDSSYGSDPTTRNFRAPSYSFYDNARWVTLSRMFGTGFVPIGCL